MPIYEYRCSECGFQKEFLQKISDPLLTTCTSCGKETFQKMLTAAGFQLKGSGWYATDFKHSGTKPAAKSEDSGKAGAAKSDSKPDGAADSATKSAETSTTPSSGTGSDAAASTSTTTTTSTTTGSSAST